VGTVIETSIGGKSSSDGIGLSLVARLAVRRAGADGPRTKECGQFYTDLFSR
jgi:hypothetical protein